MIINHDNNDNNIFLTFDYDNNDIKIDKIVIMITSEK